ncbi:UDP-glucose--undecaprenyl-phosphate glucosyltransferase [Syntrophotalea carbinolica DSM 2380]|uniref:dolichyl-phosphate beta-glucosyltransferase n=1 Tax=Syntrophotalea carbinolica (strain DSM 2380 / NBRC 103641 / GraBd1) TaxID=338963 RepID=Q3A3Q6_SYNC1|nr:dolichyl-phosphate beta-glucosyltransferase [Syntrophotalea carbinolica]ABA89001.1 UDP-glucose--undecaprenyl-phosphate glucosyltransferase [Syntrophotalea carbinolica DSM 2380]
MTNDHRMLSVVVPAYNEEKRLSASLEVLCEKVGLFFPRFEIIVVDDGSTDKTADIVMTHSRKYSDVRLIRYEKNRGKGYAVRTGVLAAKGDFVLFSDADLSTPIEEVEKLFGALADGADVAIGSRAVRQSLILKSQPLYRMVMGKTFNKFVQLLAIPGILDTQCGFKLFTRSAALNLFRDCRIDGFGFDVEVLFLARKRGMDIREIGVSWVNSPDSKVHPIVDSARMLQDLVVIRRHALLGDYGDLRLPQAKIETVSPD